MEQAPIRVKSRAWWSIMKGLQRGFDLIIAIDLETTGLDVEYTEIIQVGIVKIDARKQMTTGIDRLFKPTSRIPLSAYRVHGIGEAKLEGKAPSYEALDFIAQECNGNNLIVGYNIHKFDLPVIWNSHARYRERLNVKPEPFLPSHTLDLFSLLTSRHPVPGGRRDLSTCFSTFTGCERLKAHNALHDCHTCINMLPMMVEHYLLPKGRAAIKRATKNAEITGLNMKYFLNEDQLFEKLVEIVKSQKFKPIPTLIISSPSPSN